MFDSGEAKNHCELLLTDPAEYADKYVNYLITG